eukprot:148205-Rhodomonas_salina.1
MSEFFTVSDDGELRWYLGDRFNKTKDCYHAVQTPYINKLHQKLGLEQAYDKDVPMDPNFSLNESDIPTAEEADPKDVKIYRELVRSLGWVVTWTRSDCAFS